MTDRTELRRMLDGATPRPWEWTTDLDALLGGEEGEYRVIDTALALRSYYVLRVASEDAALIAAAVNALPGLLDQLDAAEAALARVRELHGGWSSQADFNAEMGGDFWRGMTIKGRECADELRRALDGGEQS